MSPVHFFPQIRLEPPRTSIYRRLGYRSASTRVSEEQRRETEAAIDAAADLILLKGASFRLAVIDKGPDWIVLAGGEVLMSRQLAALIGESPEVLLMGATAGETIMAAIREDLTGERVTRGVILDATASEMVDAALDWITAYTNRDLRRENRGLLPKRYSAGYGDLALENQETFHRLLELDRIGVQITASSLLVPEKSVTAITGIRGYTADSHIDAASQARPS